MPSLGDLCEPPFQEAALRFLSCERERPLVRLARILRPAETTAEVGAGRVGQAVILQIAAVENLVDERRPAAGPSRIATATARFSSMTGDASRSQQNVVQTDDLVPVGRDPARAPPRARAAIAA